MVTARVISSATYADVALLQLDSVPPGLAPAHLGDSDKVEVGDEVFVVGAPYGLSSTLTVGHVSGRGVPKSSLASMSALVQGDLARVLNLPQPAGFVVQRVAAGSLGWRLGIRPGAFRLSIEGSDLLLGGDIILSVNGIEILEGDASLDRIYESMSTLAPGERVVTRVLRVGQVIELATSQ